MKLKLLESRMKKKNIWNYMAMVVHKPNSGIKCMPDFRNPWFSPLLIVLGHISHPSSSLLRSAFKFFHLLLEKKEGKKWPRPSETMRNQAIDEYEYMNTGNGIATMITWNYGGNQVAIEGSWDNWRSREFLQKTGKEFTLVKLLPPGVYHYRFVADGHYRYDPDLPHEGDDRGNAFNVLDLQDQAPEMMDNVGMNEAPSSPLSSYTSIPFSLEDYNEKLPDLPPLLQKTPLDQPSRSMEGIETLQKPLPAILNHLYIQTGESMVALGSTHRFRRKYVTTILYKSSKNPKK